MDGVAAQEGRLLFMTTNHIERLSEALIRPGRVDVRLEFTYASQSQIHDFFLNFYQVDPPSRTLASDTWTVFHSEVQRCSCC